MIFEFSIECDKIFHYTIKDRDNPRSEPEHYLNEDMDQEFNKVGKKLTLENIGFTVSKINVPFYFSIKDYNGYNYYYFY